MFSRPHHILLAVLISSGVSQPVWAWPDTGEVWVDHGLDEDGDTWPDEVDCDDNDASVYPGAPDEPYDGIDSDCQKDNDFDQDEDGFIPSEHVMKRTLPDPDNEILILPGGDCNDKNPDVYPYAEDAEGNTIDENCDGVDGKSCGGGSAFILFILPISAGLRRFS